MPAGDRLASPSCWPNSAVPRTRRSRSTATLPGSFAQSRPYVNHAPEVVEEYKHANCWFGVNPTGPLAGYGRGKAEDVVRMAALPVDLDFGEGKCGSPEVAFNILEDLSAIMGPPAAITYSGHGLHPYWPISDGAKSTRSSPPSRPRRCWRGTTGW